ncbi:hypothetical protein K8354_13240 [Polaribacter litorisediminis]|uniref:hypothetical protein n=1 Tax=Polaribacter litorisediminis TaxID=1908341 RepID=UPI001CBE09C5|nr:hypothetical protein [Polaribacter litorisediminis]UAM97278.1 hypothetical protein K8354_13240 [Polaribacter litorisediminis]
MELTEIQRINSKASLQEFLFRYFLILDEDIDAIALDFINYEIIIETSVLTSNFKNKEVCFDLLDIENFMGIEISEEPYSITTSSLDFIKNYRFKIPHKFNGNSRTSLNFEYTLEFLSKTKQKQAKQLSEFITQKMPNIVFENYVLKFPETVELYHELN